MKGSFQLLCFVCVSCYDINAVLDFPASGGKNRLLDFSLHFSLCNRWQPRSYLTAGSQCSDSKHPLACSSMQWLKIQAKMNILCLRGGVSCEERNEDMDKADQAMIDEARTALKGRDILEVTESTDKAMQAIKQELDEHGQIPVKVPGGSIPMYSDGRQVNWTRRGDSPPPPSARSFLLLSLQHSECMRFSKQTLWPVAPACARAVASLFKTRGPVRC
jgi:hypothetical protein